MLGYCAWEYTPTRRGFDTFLGFYLGSQNHFSHDRDYKSHPDDPPAFYDFRHNEEVAEEYRDQYSTVVFRDRTLKIIHDAAETRDLNAYANYDPFFIYLAFQATHAPLQARAEILAQIPQSTNPARDIYKAMVLDMDLAVGEIVDQLKEKGLYNDTIIIVTSDNGGAISHGASNYPLRGTKGTLFEGGTRVPTFVHGPEHLLPQRGVISKSLVHITDWMPTLLKMAGYQGDPVQDLGLDGVDQAPVLQQDENVREEMVYNLKIDPVSGAYRFGNFKIIFGKKFNKQGWYDTDNTALQCSALKLNKKFKRKLNKNKERESRVIELNTVKQISKTLETLEPEDAKKNKESKKNVKKRKPSNKNRKKPSNGKPKNQKNAKAKRRNPKTNKSRKKPRKSKKKPSRGRKTKPSTKNKRKNNNRRKTKSKEKSKNNKSQKSKARGRSEDKEERMRDKELRRQNKRDQKKDERKENKIHKLWKDWLPSPSLEVQNMLRLRMDDCNWEDFSDSGHQVDDLHLIPREAFRFGDMVQIINPMMNPFNISADDEDREFADEIVLSRADLENHQILEKRFNKLDFGMYNIIDDPYEKKDLKHDLPDIFNDLKRKTLEHLKNVVPADWPLQDFSGHPRNFDGYFSPGWCSPSSES